MVEPQFATLYSQYALCAQSALSFLDYDQLASLCVAFDEFRSLFYKAYSMTTRPSPRLLDTRTIQRNIRRGLLTQTEYQQYLEELPDAAENILPAAEGGDDDGYEKKKVKPAPEQAGWAPSAGVFGHRRPSLYPSAPASHLSAMTPSPRPLSANPNISPAEYGAPVHPSVSRTSSPHQDHSSLEHELPSPSPEVSSPNSDFSSPKSGPDSSNEHPSSIENKQPSSMALPSNSPSNLSAVEQERFHPTSIPSPNNNLQNTPQNVFTPEQNLSSSPTPSSPVEEASPLPRATEQSLTDSQGAALEHHETDKNPSSYSFSESPAEENTPVDENSSS